MKSSNVPLDCFRSSAVGFLCLFASLGAPSSLWAQAPFGSACLVYNSRTTSKSTGYSSESYTSTGMAVVGEEFTAQVEGYAGDGSPAQVEVKKRMVREYYFSTDSADKKKKYFFEGSTYDRIVGAINMAKGGNTTKPSVSVALTFGDYANTSLNEGIAIGKASWKSPYDGIAPGWLAASLSSSYKFYDVNPDRNYEDPTAPYNYVGQAQSPYLPCTMTAGKTTYALDSKRTESVKEKNFEDACAAVEAWLISSGYEKISNGAGPES